MNDKSAILPLARRKAKNDEFNRCVLNVLYVRVYKYLGIVFDYTLKFDLSLRKVVKSVREMNNYRVLTQDNLSLNQKLSIWNTYFLSKLSYPLLVLSLLNKSAMKRVVSQMTVSIKNCLGLNRALSNQKLYTWIYGLTPVEKAELSLL